MEDQKWTGEGVGTSSKERDKEAHVNKQTSLTGKGALYLHHLLVEEANVLKVIRVGKDTIALQA